MSNSPKVSKATKLARLKHNIPLYLMFLPGALYLLINNYIPMGGLIIAFKQVNWNKGILKSPWVGLSNFEYLFKTKEAWNITRNTLGYNIIFIVLGTVIAIAIAILLNEIKVMAMKKTYQTIILLPYLISMVVVSYLVYALLSSESGFINLSILRPLGKPEIAWYTEPKYWPAILIIVYIWKTFGYNCILYYATLVGIDRGYYEAAVIDGASRWKQTIYITLPELSSTIVVLLILRLGQIMNVGYEKTILMYSPATYDTADVIASYVYRVGIIDADYGYSTAINFFNSIVNFIVLFVANTISRKLSETSLW